MRTVLLGLLTVAGLQGAVSAQQPTPESPSLWREVLGVDGRNPDAPTFTRPHMPGLRVTRDGRIGMMVEGTGGFVVEGHAPAFALFKPEKLVQPFLTSPPSAHTMSSSAWSYMNGVSTWYGLLAEYAPGADALLHGCIWDDAPPTSVAGTDVYDFKVLVTSMTSIGGQSRMQLHATPVRVIVASPKTAAATIASVTRSGPTVSAPPMPYRSGGWEPIVCGDGRLLVLRVGLYTNVSWTNPNSGRPMQNVADIVYSYYPTGPTADPNGWTNLIPISFAPYDDRINDKFGFAMAPFRDAEGTPIPPGEDIGGSYPWIDRAAKNLFLETLGDRAKFFYGATSSPLPSRYPQFAVDNDFSHQPAVDTGGKHQGVAFLGLWSHGKLVMVDNLNNDIDYAMGRSDRPQTREVLLFDATNDPDATHDRLTMGYGRATQRMPAGENDNGNIIDSLEARFTYRRHFRPIRFGDVTWHVTNGKHTDELSFDDYIDPDAFLVVNMSGALTFADDPYAPSNRFEHHDGWLHPHGPFVKPVRLQNAATGTRWNVPAHGLASSGSRLEPAATGGVHGKGFWLTGENGVEFTVPAQPRPVGDTDWYIGVFVDCRHHDDQTERTVLTFPDGSSLRLRGRRQVVYAHASGAALQRITLPPVTGGATTDLLPYRGWAHLGLQVFDAGHRVDFHLNGLLFHRWRDSARSLFQLPPGTLTLGRSGSGDTPGIKAWVDDLAVFAHTFDPESLCNHAGGTLIGLDPNYVGEWRTEHADRYPDWVHDEISAELRNRGETGSPRYACYHSYDQDHGAHFENLPPLTRSLRAAIQFPEGPLFHNAPRPHSLQNRFCTSCHHVDGRLGLGLQALAWNPAWTAADDPRRQPMQPPARIHGTIPPGLIDTVTPPQPLSPVVTPPDGLPIDAWMLPTWSGPAMVESLTVLDPSSGQDLCELVEGMTLDPMALGVSTVAIRANLDSAQGAVTHQWNLQPSATTFLPPHEHTISLVPGAHSLTAWPASGSPVSRSFTVPGSGWRVLSSYSDAFRDGAPDPNWSYTWNAAGDVADPTPYQALNWSPTHEMYNGSGLALPDSGSLSYGFLDATGGHPGQSTSQQGGGPERFVLAGYEVRAPGTYRVQNGTGQVPNLNSDGIRVVILVRDASSVQVHYDATFDAGLPFTIPTVDLPGLTTGKTIHVGIGPRSISHYDTFAFDFEIAVQ